MSQSNMWQRPRLDATMCGCINFSSTDDQPAAKPNIPQIAFNAAASVHRQPRACVEATIMLATSMHFVDLYGESGILQKIGTILRRSASWRYVRNNTEQSRVPQTEHRSFLFLQAQESHAFFCKPQACSSSFIIGLATSSCRLPTLDPSSTRVVPTIYNTHTFQTSPHFNLMPWSNPMH